MEVKHAEHLETIKHEHEEAIKQARMELEKIKTDSEKELSEKLRVKLVDLI